MGSTEGQGKGGRAHGVVQNGRSTQRFWPIIRGIVKPIFLLRVKWIFITKKELQSAPELSPEE
jgi:hypothetical protein